MNNTDPAKLVEAMLGDETPEQQPVDPKELAMDVPYDSPLFDEFMTNYVDECRKLLKKAKASGAVPDDMPEGVLIRAVMQIAANNFRIFSPQYKRELKNLEHFL